MSSKKEKILFEGPVLPGSVSQAMAKCGNKECRCNRKSKPQLHGPYYRWTGFLNGKRTTVTLTEEEANECLRRIENFRRLQEKIALISKKGLSSAPWLDR